MAISGEWNYQGGDRDAVRRRVSRSRTTVPTPGGRAAHEVARRRRGRTSSSTPRTSRRTSRTTSSTSSSAAMPACSRTSSRPCSRWSRSSPRRGGGPGGSGSCSPPALAQGLIFIIATPYTWSGGGRRQPVLHRRLRRDAVPAAADRSRWLAAIVPWVIGGAVRGAAGAESVRRVVPAADNAEERSAPAAAGRADATSTICRSTPSPIAAGVWFGDCPARAIPDSRSTSSTTTPTVARRTRASGCAAESRAELPDQDGSADRQAPRSRSPRARCRPTSTHPRRRPNASDVTSSPASTRAGVVRPAARASVREGGRSALVWMASVSSTTGSCRSSTTRIDRHPLPRRAREARCSTARDRSEPIAVVTSSPPMVEGGHMVIARALVAGAPRRRALGRHRRHAAEPLRPPGLRLSGDLADRRRHRRRQRRSIR